MNKSPSRARCPKCKKVRKMDGKLSSGTIDGIKVCHVCMIRQVEPKWRPGMLIPNECLELPKQRTLTQIDIAKFNSLVNDGWLRKQTHPSGDLIIWNYTEKCTFERHWTEETMMSRGLITDTQGNIVARPFRKFFNLEEHQGSLPSSVPSVYQKLDGSLGILYFYKDVPYIATRGSFVSEQAVEANKMLAELKHQPPFQKGRTYLFEIIYPQNKIVVDYGKSRHLCLLAIIDNETGLDIDTEQDEVIFDRPMRFIMATMEDVLSLQKGEWANSEGFVLVWSDGFRIKMKLANYIRLHRLLTGITARRIWDLLRNKQQTDLAEIRQRVPEEFLQWVDQTVDGLNDQYSEIESKARSLLETLHGTRADMAKRLKREDSIIMTVCFRMLDKKPYDDAIWKHLKPEHEKPFKVIE